MGPCLDVQSSFLWKSGLRKFVCLGFCIRVKQILNSWLAVLPIYHISSLSKYDATFYLM